MEAINLREQAQSNIKTDFIEKVKSNLSETIWVDEVKAITSLNSFDKMRFDQNWIICSERMSLKESQKQLIRENEHRKVTCLNQFLFQDYLKTIVTNLLGWNLNKIIEPMDLKRRSNQYFRSYWFDRMEIKKNYWN